MKNEFTIIPHVVINPSHIVSYNECVYEKKRHRQTMHYINLERPVEEQTAFIKSTRKAEGKVSDQAKRKISKAIEYLVTTAHEKKTVERLTGKFVVFRVAFLTLTLPSKQIHSDAEIINKCLNSFLIELTRYHCVKNYVWRAELQKNGNIHFHILLDKFVGWYDARNRWNRIINKLGYVDRFHEKHGHRTPNSTDIHSTRKIKNLKAYLTKYMSKDVNYNESEPKDIENDRKQEGRIWSCNHELSQTRGLNLIVDSEIESELMKIVSRKEVRKYEGSYFTVYYVDYHFFRKCGSDLLFKYFSDYLFDQLHFSEQLKIA